MQLGTGYWSLPAIDRRIVEIEKRKPRNWNKRLKELIATRRRVIESADKTRTVKGWMGRKNREIRYNKIRVMLRDHSLSYVGKNFKISRQRVHQIVSTWK